MKVGFIGAGTVTATIGRHLINAGRTIVVSNSRTREDVKTWFEFGELDDYVSFGGKA